ncbi:MAG: DUF6427 family protein [Bacteroidales bacterium]|jgi:hypothetical protein|nr:DUF6427 family protein [Bacteroidales bacterium]
MLFKKVVHKKNLQRILIFILSVLGLLKLIFENKIYPFAQDDINFLGQYTINVYGEYYWFFKTAVFILFIVNALLLTFILRKHKLIELHKYFPAIFYLLLFLFFLKTSFFIPLFINSLIILFLIPPFLKISEKDYKEKNGIVFGIFCGLIILVYAPFIFYFLLIYLIFILNNFYNWRNYILPFLGLIITCIYFFSILYFIDFKDFDTLLAAYTSQFKITISFSYIGYQIILYSILLILYLIFSYSIFSRSANMNIFIRKKYYFFLLSSLFGLLFCFLFREIQAIGFILFLTLLSSMGGILYSGTKK